MRARGDRLYIFIIPGPAENLLQIKVYYRSSPAENLLQMTSTKKY